jgi:RHS repeat-associated protein
LKTLTGPSVVASNSYNGLGDRLQETLNVQTTTFTMDLNMSLTQTLSDGTNTYIYGVDRIAQTQGGATEYFLGDALGSVRQLANNSGAVTYARAYDPYGVVASTIGTSHSSYAFTGEYSGDYNELLHLRARFYAPGMGRFLSKDTWPGSYGQPLTLNKWNVTAHARTG